MHRTLPYSRLQAVLYVLVHVFPHSLPAALVLHLGQAQRSMELQQLTLLLWNLGTTVLRPCSVAEHGNQYTPRCFSNFAACGSFTHVLKNSPLEPGNIA